MRQCESCGNRMERGRKRHRMPGGALVCPSCASGRPGGGNVQANRKVAHDSGDGATIYHCPFCGAGGVTGRSDGSAECAYCKSVFTVQVQPEFSAMPQTYPDTGEPVQMPGMPGQQTQPGEAPVGLPGQLPGAPGADAAAGGKTKFAFPEDIDPDEAAQHIQDVGAKGAPPPQAEPGKDEIKPGDAKPGDKSDAKSDGKSDGDKKDLPPWLKKKTKLAFDTTGFDPTDPTNEKAFGDLANDKLDQTGGFSMSLHARTPTKGYMVSLPGHEEHHAHLADVTPDSIADYMERHMDVLEQPGTHLGGWVDHTSGQVYLDVSQRVDDEAQARQLGVQNGQKAIWDLAGGKEIRLDQGQTPSMPPQPAPAQMAASKSAYFITDDGTALPTDDYMQYLAYTHREDR